MNDDISQFIPLYTNANESSFFEDIYRKEEFYKHKLKPEEQINSDAKKYLEHQTMISKFLSSNTPYDSILLVHEPGTGKCHAENTPIIMFDGKIKKVQKIKEGDLLMGDDSKPRTVLSLATGKSRMFNIHTDCGDFYKVNPEHILCLKLKTKCTIMDEYKRKPKTPWSANFYDLSDKRKKVLYFKEKHEALLYKTEYDNKEKILEIEVDKYILLSNKLKKKLCGYRNTIDFPSKKCILNPYTTGIHYASGLMPCFLVKSTYVCNDEYTRINFLAGILDSSAYLEGKIYCIPKRCNKYNKTIVFLLRSLGAKIIAHNTDKIKFIYNKIIPTKIITQHVSSYSNTYQIKVSFEDIIQNYYGFIISDNNRYMLGDCTITHNTCTSIAAIERIKEEKSSIAGAMIFTRGINLQRNYINELMFKCKSADSYDKKGKQIITPYMASKITENFYKFYTYDTFIKTIKNTSSSMLAKQFSNNVIVMDEIHNIRNHESVDIVDENGIEINVDLYSMYHKFLHAVKNCKIILMSATPMRDSAYEIADILNLMLPIKDQLPTANAFNKEFFKDGEITNIGILEKAIQGKISYLKSIESIVKKEYVGDKILTFGKTNINICGIEMSDFQSAAYLKAVNKDKSGKTGIYPNALQSSLFVFPDGTYGEEGFKNHVRVKAGRKMDIQVQKEVYDLQPDFRKQLVSKDKNLLDEVRKLSCKYAYVIDIIESCYKNGSNCFVFCDFVKGSGLILFSLILELFGFRQTNGDVDKPAKRYAMITGTNHTNNEIINIMKTFNSRENRHGKFISVILGSSAIAEGFSFMNVTTECILTPTWNYSKLEQIIGRGVRYNSHKDLIEDGETPVVKIHYIAAVTDKSNKTIDIYMYDTCLQKDLQIKQMERLLKTHAVDCSLNKDRNMNLLNTDGSRECEYTKCEYKCSGVSDKEIEKDYSTYNIYYKSEYYNDCLEKIMLLYKNGYSYKLEEIKSKITGYNSFQILTVLSHIIQENIILEDMDGISCFLSNMEDVFFLSINSGHKRYLSDIYYSVNKIEKSVKTIPEYISEYSASILEMLPSNLNNFNTLIEILDDSVQQMVLEQALTPSTPNSNFKNKVLEYYVGKYTEINGILYVKLKYDMSKFNALRIFKDDKWNNCSPSEVSEYEKFNQSKIQTQYSCLYNKIEDQFFIRDNSTLKENDPRKVSKGRVCTTIKKHDLIKIMIANNISFPEKTTFVKNAIAAKNMFGDELNNYSNDDKQKIYQLVNLTVKQICNLMKTDCENKNTLEYI